MDRIETLENQAKQTEKPKIVGKVDEEPKSEANSDTNTNVKPKNGETPATFAAKALRLSLALDTDESLHDVRNTLKRSLLTATPGSGPLFRVSELELPAHLKKAMDSGKGDSADPTVDIDMTVDEQEQQQPHPLADAEKSNGDVAMMMSSGGDELALLDEEIASVEAEIAGEFPVLVRWLFLCVL